MTGRPRRGKGIAAAQKRGPSTAMIAGLVVVLLFAAAVGFGVYRANQSSTAAAGPVPAGADATGITVGNATAPKTIDIYLDFQCPVCQAYEQQTGSTIEQLVAAGTAKVVYHPVAFLNRFSTTDYSTRSSAASACAADAGVFPQYLTLLYANQPPEGSAGLPDAQLIALAEQAGAPPTVAQCIDEGTYKPWTAGVTDAASKAGVNGTPTVQVGGTTIDNTTEALQAAMG